MIELRLVRPPVPALVLLRTDGQLFLGDEPAGATLEDPDRGLDSAMSLAELRRRKVLGATAIPTGRYRLFLYQSPRLGRDTLALVDVPVFFGVHLRPADDDDALDGAIAVERAALTDLRARVVPAMQAGEEAWLTVTRGEGALPPDLMPGGTASGA